MTEIIVKEKNPPDHVRKAHIHSKFFDPANIGEGGPLWTYEGPSYNTDAYREGWDRIFGKNKE